jgi:hypothetical protein
MGTETRPKAQTTFSKRNIKQLGYQGPTLVYNVEVIIAFSGVVPQSSAVRICFNID